MGDITGTQRSSVTRITGSDESVAADVIAEDGFNKLFVKASTVPQPLGNLFFEHALDGGSDDLAVNGSGTPVEFLVTPDATYDKLVSSMVFEAFDGGIKVDTFLGQNSDLTNGVLIEVKSEDSTFQFLPILNTQHFDSHFSSGPGRSFELIVASGNDSIVARFGPATPFILKPVGTYATDDYIKVIIRDNLSNVSNFKFLAIGQLDI